LYRLAGTVGPDHSKVFEIEVVLEGEVVAKGRGKNKKEAEQVGAEEALAKVKAS
jgi:ribonuclease-3